MKTEAGTRRDLDGEDVRARPALGPRAPGAWAVPGMTGRCLASCVLEAGRRLRNRGRGGKTVAGRPLPPRVVPDTRFPQP